MRHLDLRQFFSTHIPASKSLFELYEEDGKLRKELEKMGLKFERKWWHGPLGKPLNFEAD